LLAQPGVKSNLASLSLNQEASQKELEGVRKMAQRPTLPRHSGGSESSAKNTSTSPGPMLKKAKNKCASIYNCSLFIEVFLELSKHTPYLLTALFRPNQRTTSMEVSFFKVTCPILPVYRYFATLSTVPDVACHICAKVRLAATSKFM
jgi:hypothetical protein